MSDIRLALDSWVQNLCGEISIAGVIARDRDAHRSMAPSRSLILRNATAWRAHDLLIQALLLSDAGHLLGARILVRAAIETLAVLSYLNDLMYGVIEGKTAYSDFMEKTKKLALGSKNKSTPLEAVNVLTLIQKADKRVPGLLSTFEELSESAHPNHDGLVDGYLTWKDDGFTASFSNKWAEKFQSGFESYALVVAQLYYIEHDIRWIDAFEALERWLRENPQVSAEEAGG